MLVAIDAPFAYISPVSNALSAELLHTRMSDTFRDGKRILLVRTDRLGDVVLTLPMLSALRKHFPDAYLAILLRRYTSPIVERNPHLDAVIPYDEDDRLIPVNEMVRRIKEYRFDFAIVARPMLRVAWITFRAAIPLRVGTGFRYYSILFNKRVFEHRKDAKRHELDYNLNLLKSIGCSVEDPPDFSLQIPPDNEAKIESLFRQFSIDHDKEVVVIHPGTGGSAREWPADFFGKLANRLQEERGAQVILTGAKGEERKVAEVLLGSKGKAIPLVGRLSLMELGAVIKRANLFISNSTGPLHMAAALGTPVVSLFPQLVPMSAARWGPYTSKKRVLVPDKPINCQDCLHKAMTSCACMASISVDEVYRAACSLLVEYGTSQLVSHG